MTIFTTSVSFYIFKLMQPFTNIPKIVHENKDLPEYPLQLYEVIRVIDSIPVFFEDHLERLFNSAHLLNVENMPNEGVIEENVLNLISTENQQIGNLRLSFTISGPSVQPKFELDFIPHFYPSDDKYESGVKVGLLCAERHNPQAKVQNTAIRNKANLLMSKENVFEVLLVDHEENITEGSRSNVFFISKNNLITSPDEKVLQGITRKKIIQLCGDNNISVIKKDISSGETVNFEGAFLTGSSPKVLPISAIGDIGFSPSNHLIKRIINLYDKAIEDYLKLRKPRQ
jgi:branched-chain amino acid aminotransferase